MPEELPVTGGTGPLPVLLLVVVTGLIVLTIVGYILEVKRNA